MSSKSSRKCDNCVAGKINSLVAEDLKKDNCTVIIINCPHCIKEPRHAKNKKASVPLERSSNRDDENLKSLCEVWFKHYGDGNVLAWELRKLAERNGLFKYMDFSSRKHQVVFSKLLTNRNGQDYGGLKVCVDKSAKYNFYYLEITAPNEQ